jgi:hypothetical protein
MIFPIIECDKVIQVGDKFRISCAKSYKTLNEAAFVEVRIKPSAADSFITVATGSTVLPVDNWYLDWTYDSAGTKTITVEIDNGLGPTTTTATLDVSVITEAIDKLFSSDDDLKKHQHDITSYVPPGRATWKFVHRRSQELILSYFDEEGRVNDDGTKITKDQVVDLSEVKELSVYMTLRLIFESISNSPDDYFIKKAKYWEVYELKAKQRAVTRLDFDKDGNTDLDVVVDNFTIKAGRK